MCFYCLPLLAKPGIDGEILISDKKLETYLYIASVSVSENSELKGIELAWIPESVKTQCIGKNTEECRGLWQEKAVERHNRYLQSQENLPLSERNLNYSFGTDEKDPPEVLSMWISKEDLDLSNKKALNQISQLGFIKNLCRSMKGEVKFLISEDKKIHAKIRYIQFSNGQSFQVIDVFDK